MGGFGVEITYFVHFVVERVLTPTVETLNSFLSSHSLSLESLLL